MKTPWHLWVIGVASLVWNAGGAYDYLMMKSANAAYLAMFSAKQLAYYDSYPLWVTVAWACGVWGAVVGSVLLLLRSRFAVQAFWLSILGLIGNFAWGLFISETPVTQLLAEGGSFDRVFTVAIVVVAVLLVWYAARKRRAGVLR